MRQVEGDLSHEISGWLADSGGTRGKWIEDTSPAGLALAGCATGYARTYALCLLNHTEEVFQTPTSLRRRYGPEVEQALVLAWKTLNRICAKRLIPFLPGIVETLEQHGHLQGSRGTLRAASTIETYARSARAFFERLLKRGVLPCSPMSLPSLPSNHSPSPACCLASDL